MQALSCGASAQVRRNCKWRNFGVIVILTWCEIGARSHTHTSQHTSNKFSHKTSFTHYLDSHAQTHNKQTHPLPRRTFAEVMSLKFVKRGGFNNDIGGVPSFRDFVFFPDALTAHTHSHIIAKTHTQSKRKHRGESSKKSSVGWDWS